MKLATVAFVAAIYLLIGTDDVSGAVETKWMTQKLDNFGNSNETWKMRYMVNEKHFEKGGPIFISVGGEMPIQAPFIEWSLLADMAAEHHGILFYPEHRFYGSSRVGKSLAMDNLEFLNARQALADLANFIQTQRTTDSRLANSKVIISGCSYAGSLAVWFNHLYPHLVDGTWAVSAPILAKVEFPEYLEITGKAIRELGSTQCYDRIQNGMAELQQMFSGERAKEAHALLKLCDFFDHINIKDVWVLFRAIQNLFTDLATGQRLEKEDIPRACDFLLKRPDDLSAIVEYFLEHYSSPGNCKSLNFLGTVFHNNKTTYDNIVSRQWMYQTCNEFGWFQESVSQKQPFGTSSPATLDMNYCYEIFGPDFTEKRIREKVAKTNQVFGGLKPNGKNLFLSYGGADPWTALGPGESEISSVVPHYSHCCHLYSISTSDSAEMVASKERVMAKVREWLA